VAVTRSLEVSRVVLPHKSDVRRCRTIADNQYAAALGRLESATFARRNMGIHLQKPKSSPDEVFGTHSHSDTGSDNEIRCMHLLSIRQLNYSVVRWIEVSSRVVDDDVSSSITTTANGHLRGAVRHEVIAG
jgi:hypothetical protein